MRRRLILLFAFAASIAGGLTAAPAHAAALGKTGAYDDGCGHKQLWVNGQNVGPYYFVCMPPE